MRKVVETKLLPYVTKPARYMGGEYNAVQKTWQPEQVKVVLAFPDVYEIGMAHLGLQILYWLINDREDALCERTYMPWTDMYQLMVQEGVPLFSLESFRPIRDFDVVGFTLQYELSYTNILHMLKLSGIPIRSKDRTDLDPLVVAGGPCAFNPEPVAEFFDVIVVGDGEEAVLDLLDLVRRAKAEGWSREQTLIEAAKIPGFYVPSFYEPVYDATGRIKSLNKHPEHGAARVQKRVVADLDQAYFPTKALVPWVEPVHDRVMIEVMRGCGRGCRFCQAGFVYRPPRERDPCLLQEQALALVRNSGYEEVALTSLSSGDYSEIASLVQSLITNLGEDRVSLSLPSLRVDSFSVGLASEIQKVRKSGLTFAMEAGTERLRKVINKQVTEEDLLAAVDAAFSAGWFSVKLYFMLGLPTETETDLAGIVDIVQKLRQLGRERLGSRVGKLRISVSVATFVPKPHTPFQFCAQDPPEVVRKKQDYLRRHLRMKGVKFSCHNLEQSLMEAVFARGDRRLSRVLERAVELGCVFDGWDEHFDYELWARAFQDCGLDMSFYAHRVRDFAEINPWDHIDSGVSKEFLIKEYQTAIEEAHSPGCRERCLLCGVCQDLPVRVRLVRKSAKE